MTLSYGDGNIDRLQSKVEVPELYGMRTSERMANALEAYYERIRQEDLKGRELAVAGRFPLAHALSNHKVFFKETWSDLSILDKEKQLEMLYNAETLPIIVLGAVSENSFASQVQAFAESHSYRKTEHSLFTFYTPNE